MRLRTRKLIVLVLIGSVSLLANVWFVVNWLEEVGAIEFAKYVKAEFLTGTALTIILVLLFLLVRPGKEAPAGPGFFRRCSVCDHKLITRGSYCPECGSKV